MAWIEPLSKNFFPKSRAYQLSQSVHYASADIYNQYQHSPMNEFQLFLLFFFICFFLPAVFTIIFSSTIMENMRSIHRASHFYI